MPPPAGYIPIRTPARKLSATPTPIAGTPHGFFLQTEEKQGKFQEAQPKDGNLPFLKPEDAQYFDKVSNFTILFCILIVLKVSICN